MQKITTAESDIRQALEGIECPRYVKSAIWNEWRSGYIDNILEQVIQHNLAEDVQSGIRFLISYYKDNNKSKKVKVTLSDIEKTSNNKELYKKLDSISGKQKELRGKKDISREFGTRGHIAIPNLFTGDYIKVDKTEKGANIAIQQELDFDDKRKSIRSDSISYRHILKIQDVWKKMISRKKTEMFLTYTSSEYEKFYDLLKVVFRDECQKVLALGQSSKASEYLAFLTFLTWATAVIQYRNVGSRVLFKEIRLLPHHYDVSLGRVDALEVVSIDGNAPSEKQLKILRKLAGERYSSIGHLIYTLVQRFGSKIELLLYDWKFAVGDGDNGVGKTLNIIHSELIKYEPILKHKNQMERYLATSMISYAMVANGKSRKEAIWDTDDFSISGEVHYFFPDKMPLVYRFDISNEEKKKIFEAHVANNYIDGEFRRKFLNVSEGWLKLAVGLHINDFSVKGSRAGQIAFPGILDSTQKVDDVHITGRISKVIKESAYRNFIGEYGFIEDRGEGSPGHYRYWLHLDKLFDAIDEGKIMTKNFDFARGGFISCPMPDHLEKTPSYSVTYKSEGFGKCFGCGAYAKVAPESVPENFQGRIQAATKRLFVKSFGDIEKFYVPDRHKEIMIAAQRILQSQFLTSPGAQYLREDRKLEPELSMIRLGAGYADDRLIHYLLDNGFQYDELIESGLVRISPRVKETGKLVSLLKNRGFAIEDMRREVDITVDKKPAKGLGLPYSILDNRLTYPLEVNGVITSFYGRSVDQNCPKDFRHQKTVCDTIAQGGFNLTNAMNNAYDKARKKGEPPIILVTEAAIDADTVFQRSKDLKEATAFVGTSNHLLWQIVGTFEGSIVTAMNIDPSNIVNGVERGMSGQRQTIKFVEFLKSIGFRHPVYDFSQAFVKKHPRFNDLNGFWQEVYNDYWERKIPKSEDILMNPFDFLFNKKRIL